jgi:hypothetical protein
VSLQPLAVVEPTQADVGQRRMRKDHLIGIEAHAGSARVHRRPQRMAEEHQLKAELLTGTATQVAGPVPPLGTESGVRPVVAGPVPLRRPRGAQEALRVLGTKHERQPPRVRQPDAAGLELVPPVAGAEAQRQPKHPPPGPRRHP